MSEAVESLLLDADHENAELHLRHAASEATLLNHAQLYRPCSLDLGTCTTADLQDPIAPAGQERALDAIRFGIGMRHAGYNVFVIGSDGAARVDVIRPLLEEHAAKQPAPFDCCYVQNFEDASRPELLMLPAGRGTAFRKDVEELVDELLSTLPAIFESDDYRKQHQAIEDEVTRQRENVIATFRKRAEEIGFAFVETPTGFVFAPKKDDDLLGHDDFHKLPEQEQERLTAQMQLLGADLKEILAQVPKWESDARRRIRELDRRLATEAIANLVEALRGRYADLPDVVAYILALEHDVIEHANEFLQEPEAVSELMTLIGGDERSRLRVLRRYRVNVLVAHDAAKGAPVILEENPTHPNLSGQVEYFAHLGALFTDFNLIKPGALHRANGGYLIVDARRLLQQPFSWEALKRALRSGKLAIESLASLYGVSTTTTLHPKAMPVDVKIVLIGDRTLYLLLSAFDPEFAELFKIAAELDDQMERTQDHEMLAARTLASFVRKEKLLPFDHYAIARAVEQASRWTGDAEKVSTENARLADLAREANYWARQEQCSFVTASHIDRAVESRIHRLSLLSERLTDEIRRGTILVDTDGERVGIANGISVWQFGDVLFGRPTRISATISPGEGEVIDIEREVKLGRPVHSKGVMILSGYIAGRFAVDFPLSLRASIVFEQSYSEVEGDSASSAEVYALLSAISGIPIRQGLAVTGSVNQAGEIQAVGAINEKIEGFFDVCNARGLSGRQGVVIPRPNVKHLMLRKDVIAAVREGRFHIHAVSTIDEGIEVLTGIAAGGCEDGIFDPATVNGVVQMRLAFLAQTRRAFPPASETV